MSQVADRRLGIDWANEMFADVLGMDAASTTDRAHLRSALPFAVMPAKQVNPATVGRKVTGDGVEATS